MTLYTNRIHNNNFVTIADRSFSALTARPLLKREQIIFFLFQIRSTDFQTHCFRFLRCCVCTWPSPMMMLIFNDTYIYIIRYARFVADYIKKEALASLPMILGVPPMVAIYTFCASRCSKKKKVNIFHSYNTSCPLVLLLLHRAKKNNCVAELSLYHSKVCTF